MMKAARCLAAMFLLFMLTASSGYSQNTKVRTKAQVPATSAPAVGDVLPAEQVEFGAPQPVPGVTGSPVIIMPIQCASDGSLFVQTLLPPLFREMRVSSLGDKGGIVYSFSNIPNLYDVTLLSFFPTSGNVVFLVYATADAEVSHYSMATSHGISDKEGRTGRHQDYLIIYDSDGNYESTITLDPTLEYRKVAELESGEFVMLAYNPVNRVAVVEVLDSSGKTLHHLLLPEQVTDAPALRNGEAGGDIMAMKASTSLSALQFVMAQQKVILYQPHSLAPVLEVGAGGSVREVPLSAPSGYELDGFIPATDAWIARFTKTGITSGSVRDASTRSGNYQLYEMNPLDGSVTMRLATGSGSVFNVACELDGSLISLSLDKKSGFEKAVAQLPK